MLAFCVVIIGRMIRQFSSLDDKVNFLLPTGTCFTIHYKTLICIKETNKKQNKNTTSQVFICINTKDSMYKQQPSSYTSSKYHSSCSALFSGSNENKHVSHFCQFQNILAYTFFSLLNHHQYFCFQIS